jgi:NitT/TauT family transport system ATP-binding protein
MEIGLNGVGIRFRSGTVALRDFTLTVGSGEFVALVGPSGCGKSTLLNAIAGLVPEELAEVTGEIRLGPDGHRHSARDLNLGYVFQRDCLLPWRTIAENVEMGLQIRGQPRQQRRRRAAELLEMVGLTGFDDHYPYQVSGGMRQRTSLARTLAYSPSLILMDEPFGALDAQNRMLLQSELLRIWEQSRNTILFVTHDLGEAILLAQRVAVVSERPGTIRRIYDIDIPYPRDPFELRGSAQFAELETTVWQTLREEFAGGRPASRN